MLIKNELYTLNDTQLAFDCFYVYTVGMLNNCYPLSNISITSRDPPYIACSKEYAPP